MLSCGPQKAFTQKKKPVYLTALKFSVSEIKHEMQNFVKLDLHVTELIPGVCVFLFNYNCQLCQESEMLLLKICQNKVILLTSLSENSFEAACGMARWALMPSPSALFASWEQLQAVALTAAEKLLCCLDGLFSPAQLETLAAPSLDATETRAKHSFVLHRFRFSLLSSSVAASWKGGGWCRRWRRGVLRDQL